MQESDSFWTDIKNLEERLAKSPDSFCFARLSEVYLKVGLVDDAIHVARQGVIKHPGYLSGQRALSQACHAKGLNDEALVALKLVTSALPEDVPSQKLMGRIYSETGNQDDALQAFRTALEFAPDDMECRIELEYLERSSGTTAYASESEEDGEEILEDLEIWEEDQTESEFQPQEAPFISDIEAIQSHDPLSTGTLAELYVKQGFINKALEIYRAILADNPSDQVMADRVAELEALETGVSEPNLELDDTFEDNIAEETVFGVPDEAFFQGVNQIPQPEPEFITAPENQPVFADVYEFESGASVVPQQGVADNALSTLDRWLENIRRIKSCR